MNKQKILKLDRSYRPLSWIETDKAILHEFTGEVVDHLGQEIILYRGGVSRMTGKESSVVTSSIIVVAGEPDKKKFRTIPPLNNNAMFQRDRFVCAYCGRAYKDHDLTRDHIHPVAHGGKDVWTNVVTACKPCNNLKCDVMPGKMLPFGRFSPQGTRTMDPLYVPYVPCPAEAMIMKNRNILADQMEFLMERITNKDKSRVYQAWSSGRDAIIG